MRKRHKEPIFSNTGSRKQARGRKSHCQQPSQYQLLCRAQVQMKIELTFWAFKILKLKRQVLGLSHGKKQSIGQSFPAFEKCQNKMELQVQAVFFSWEITIYKALIYPSKGKRQGLYHITIKQALRVGVVLADIGVMRTLKVILTKMSDFNDETKR